MRRPATSLPCSRAPLPDIMHRHTCSCKLGDTRSRWEEASIVPLSPRCQICRNRLALREMAPQHRLKLRLCEALMRSEAGQGGRARAGS